MELITALMPSRQIMTNWNKYSEIEKAKISYQKEQIDIKRKAWEKSDDE